MSEQNKRPNRSRARLEGSAAVAQGHNTAAAGAGAVIVHGNNSGDINTGTQIILSEIGTLNIAFTQPVDIAAGLVEQLVAQSQSLSKSVATDLAELMTELRRTHVTLVDKLNPLWDLKDTPAAFTKGFAKLFKTYRSFYLSKDLGDERTHCHVLGEIGQKLAAQRPHDVANDPNDVTWSQLEGLLQQLTQYDTDVIEAHYRPFMDSVYKALSQINVLLAAGNMAQAIQIKQTLVTTLEKDFANVKARFEVMGDLIGKLNTAIQK